MQVIRTLLEAQPMAALFLTIAVGYLVGHGNYATPTRFRLARLFAACSDVSP
jgi:hypothetical protein